MRRPLHTWAASVALFAGTGLLFSRSLGYDFINYDDPSYVTVNLHVQAGLTWDSIVWAFTGKADYWHPLTWLSHMLDWQLFGDNAAGHRLVSVLWHATNAVLVFQVLRRLTGAWWTAFFSAALFAWHPLRVESVVWITERKDVMSGFFFLCTLWAYIGYADRIKRDQKAVGAYALTLGLFAAGLMCKPMLVTVPLVLLVLDCWPLGRFTPAAQRVWWQTNRRIITEKLPFIVLAGLISLVTVLMQRHIGAFILDLPLGARLGNAVVSLARYLGMFFWPSALSICYQHPGYWPGLTVAGALVLLAGITLGAWYWRKTCAWIITGWLWFIVMLLPAIGIIQVGFQAMADRYTYLPILGWQLALCWTLGTLRLNKAMMGLGAAILLGACLISTWRQQGYWRESLTLFQHAVELDEQNFYAHGFLGYTYFNLGNLDAAALHSDRAIQLDPTNKIALYTLACVEDRLGHYDRAAVYLKSILDQHREYLSARYLYSIILLRLGHRTEAFSELTNVVSQSPAIVRTNLEQAFAQESRPSIALPFFEMAVVLDPKDYAARFGYGMTLEKLGRHDEALARFEETLNLKPDHSAAHLQCGILLVNRHRPAEAAGHLRAVLASHPDDPFALAGLGRAAEQLGETDAATSLFSRALILAPGNAEILRAWAETLMRRRRYPDAVVAFEQLLAIRPDDAEAQAGLGYALILCARQTEAIPHWLEALRLRPDFPGLRERLQRIRQ